MKTLGVVSLSSCSELFPTLASDTVGLGGNAEASAGVEEG